MNLRPSDVADLQFVLMDAARRPGAAALAPPGLREEMLASAAGLDYVLMLASGDGGPFDGSGPQAAAVSDAMTRAATAALDFAAVLLAEPGAAAEDFLERRVRETGLFELVRALRDAGVVVSDELSFRALTLAHDVRLKRRGCSGP
jgi:hypothetical protein